MTGANTLTRQAGLGAALMLLCAAAMVSRAEELKGIGDPTRPPPGVVLNDAGGAPGAATAASGAASGASGVEGAQQEAPKRKPVNLVLQAIRYDVSDGGAVALINDQLVHVGEKVGDMSLVSLSRNVAVLKGPDGTRRLTLLPDPQEMNQKSETATAGTAKRGRKESK